MLKTVDSLLLLVLYVDDLLIIDCLNSVIATIKRIMHERFFMKNMGPLYLSRDHSGCIKHKTVSGHVCTRSPREIPHDKLQLCP
jgi:hypothetical protein